MKFLACLNLGDDATLLFDATYVPAAASLATVTKCKDLTILLAVVYGNGNHKPHTYTENQGRIVPR